MKIAVNTGSLSFDTPTAVAQAKGLGFTTVEVNLQQAELRYDFQREPDTAFYATLAQEIRIRGMSVGSVHNLFLNAAQAFSQGARREILQLSARVTAQLGSAVLVVHPADLFVSEEALSAYLSGAPKKRGALPLVAGFDQLRDVLDELGVRLALENVSYWHDTLLTNQAEYMALLVDALDCQVALDVRRSLHRAGGRSDRRPARPRRAGWKRAPSAARSSVGRADQVAQADACGGVRHRGPCDTSGARQHPRQPRLYCTFVG
jgi:sugar phosphate isomerase/epimerase